MTGRTLGQALVAVADRQEVSAMTQAGTESRARRGPTEAAAARSEQLLTGAAAATFVVGAVALVGGFVVRLHLPASVIGLATLLIGLVLQMLSTTRLQRILIVPGVIGAFIGMALGIAHGGF
jgi:hypothetical protein